MITQTVSNKSGTNVVDRGGRWSIYGNNVVPDF